MVLFYTSIPHSFRTTLIGHLYEICQEYPVVLLAEELSPEVKTILEDKSLFPNLQEIIPVHQFTSQEKSLIKNYRRLQRLAKEVVSRYRPRLVITANDLYPFEMYLLRYAKMGGATTICIQPGGMIASRIVKKWIDLTNAYTNLPKFIPISVRLFLIPLRKYSRYLLYHWLAPLLVKELPFPGMTSLSLGATAAGTRADYQVVFTERDYDIYLKEGVPEKKLIILAHPLTRNTKRIFNALLQQKSKHTNRTKGKVICLMLPSDLIIGFHRKDLSPITERQYRNIWLELIKLIHATLPDWNIFVKPHPSSVPLTGFERRLIKISGRVNFVPPQEPAERYIKMADIMTGLPPCASTTLFIASLLRPDLPIISVDTEEEILGDYYKDFPGIDYVTTKDELEKKLKIISSGKYKKQAPPPTHSTDSTSSPRASSGQVGGLTHKGFKNTIELIQYALQEKAR